MAPGLRTPGDKGCSVPYYGHMRGVRAPLDLEERLASLLSDSIRPRLVPDLEILPWRHVLTLISHLVVERNAS